MSTTDIRIFDFLTGTDGRDWLMTQTFEKSGYYYTSSDVTIYDGSNSVISTFTVGTPEDCNVNEIQPYGLVTTKFFDTNSKTMEVLVYEHIVGNASNNYTATNKIYAIQTDGTVVAELDGYQAFFFEYKIFSYTSVLRLLLVNEGTGDDGEDYYQCDVLAPASYSNPEVSVEHTFMIPYDNVVALVGSLIDVYEIDGEIYFVTNQYEKPFYTGEWTDDYMMVIEEDNSLVINVYDKSYNQVAECKVPFEQGDDYYRLLGFGYLGDRDLSIGRFTNDNEFNFVIAIDDYMYVDDEDKFSFEVWTEAGKHCLIIDNVDEEGMILLSDIEGHEEQWAFGQTIDDEQSLRMVNIPSCELVCEIPYEINGNQITTAIDRYPYHDSYQYVIGLNSSLQDAEGNVYAQIGWYNTDLSQDHLVQINLGTNGIYFLPHVSGTTVNPYFFNSDDDHEYVYLSYVYNETTGKNETHLSVADTNGNTLKEYVGDDDKGAILSAGFINTSTTTPSMYIAYYTYDYDYSGYSWQVDLYPLPFEKFSAGGDGTADNPYLVSTFGDLRQVANDLSANYKQVNDIWMWGTKQNWDPIQNFTGSYDGDGYALNGMHIADCEDYYVGLFGYVSEATLKNITLEEPVIDLNSSNSYAGALAGYAVKNIITNTHVRDACVTGATSGVFGGISGYTLYYSELAECSFTNAYVDLPNASNVGGIAGDMRTSASVTACVASGEITAKSALGGIAGYTSSNAGAVQDCHVDLVLTAEDTVGGIIGEYNRSGLSRCYAEGTVNATESSWYGYSAGGIVGYLEPDWSNSADGAITACVALNEVVTDGDDCVGAIVGWTVECDEDYVEEGCVENGLTDCYSALSEEELTTDFFVGLGFAYGSDVTAPWTGEGLPVLYFEDEIQLPSGISTPESTSLRVCESATYNLQGQKVTDSFKGIIIKNGKKIIKI